MTYTIEINNVEFEADMINLHYISQGKVQNALTCNLKSQAELDSIRPYFDSWISNNINGIKIYKENEDLIWDLNYQFTLDEVCSQLIPNNIDETVIHQIAFRTEWISASN